MAYIRKRGALQWEARIRKKGMPQVSKTFESKSDAEKWAREIETEMDKGVFTSRNEAEGTTLREALDRYIEEYLPRLAHYQTNVYKARMIQRYALADKFMAAIRGKDIADYIKGREAEGASGNTIRLDLAMISRLFNVAIRDWGMESLNNPVLKVSKPQIAKGRERRLEAGEEERILAICSPEMQNIIRLTLETAMRRDEIASLLWCNVNLESRKATLLDTKNTKHKSDHNSRTIPLSPKALEILSVLKKECLDVQGALPECVFSQSASAITQAMRRACKSAGIEGLTFHDLRHEAISRLFENTDLDVMEIKEVTGHSSLQMLARYTHLRTERLADRLAGVRRGMIRLEHAG